jgi:uncharacterized SAM-binding protein YcdF (DUF218 family)
MTPFLFVWLLLLVGCVLIWSPQTARSGRLAATSGFVLLSLLGYGVPLEYARSVLETRYAPVDTAATRDVQWVVVLGGGYGARAMPVTSRVGPTSIYRVVEGIRLQRQVPSRTLIFTGTSRTNARQNAIAAGEFAKALGVPADRIRVDTHPRTTSEEVDAVLARVGNAPFLLVTSALHMPRAMLLFERRGLHPIAAPTQRSGSYASGAWLSVFPSGANVASAERVMHELMGIAAIKYFGRVTR